jgi:hypothetical protein
MRGRRCQYSHRYAHLHPYPPGRCAVLSAADRHIVCDAQRFAYWKRRQGRSLGRLRRTRAVHVAQNARIGRSVRMRTPTAVPTRTLDGPNTRTTLTPGAGRPRAAPTRRAGRPRAAHRIYARACVSPCPARTGDPRARLNRQPPARSQLINESATPAAEVRPQIGDFRTNV